jgi:anti-sigma regulatory factor (Ser/Thr protein kinase)
MTTANQTPPAPTQLGAEFVLPVAHNATAPSSARHTARDLLAQWGLTEDAVYDALLVISELLTNAVEHALPPVSLHLAPVRSDGHAAVRIAVTDGGPANVPGSWAATGSTDEHGRGRSIVAALTVQNGSREATLATAHWAIVEAL